MASWVAVLGDLGGCAGFPKLRQQLRATLQEVMKMPAGFVPVAESPALRPGGHLSFRRIRFGDAGSSKNLQSYVRQVPGRSA